MNHLATSKEDLFRFISTHTAFLNKTSDFCVYFIIMSFFITLILSFFKCLHTVALFYLATSNNNCNKHADKDNYI